MAAEFDPFLPFPRIPPLPPQCAVTRNFRRLRAFLLRRDTGQKYFNNNAAVFSAEFRFRRSFCVQKLTLSRPRPQRADCQACHEGRRVSERTNRCAEGCASLHHLAAWFSLRFALYTSFSSRSALSAPCRFLSPLLNPTSALAFIYVRPIQMAKVNFAITKYLARKSLRYGATHHFGAAATIHGRETPLGLSRRERDPLLP